MAAGIGRIGIEDEFAGFIPGRGWDSRRVSFHREIEDEDEVTAFCDDDLRTVIDVEDLRGRRG
jgi:hypothetical protein